MYECEIFFVKTVSMFCVDCSVYNYSYLIQSSKGMLSTEGTV